MAPLKLLTPEQKEFYERNGFIQLSDVFTDEEFEEIHREYNALFQRKENEQNSNLEGVWQGTEMQKASKGLQISVKSIHNLQMHSGVFTRLLLHQKFLDALEDVVGSPNILLHHTKAHIKPPEKGAPFLMHQDYHYFPHRNHTMVAAFIHMEDTNPENGGLCVYPGSHKLGPLPEKEVMGDNGSLYRHIDQEQFPLDKATPVIARKGDLLIFSYLLVHGSYLNLSKRSRPMFLAQIRAAEDEPTKEIHRSYCQDMVLRGVNEKMPAIITERHVK
ncbi:phytanoyl-CoA dioxygenase, peroxisomal-like [Anthonomus grandis grandis]|uniref:phytanoyl-CoA dioxygenase, peroxisomal-like n=1 Tax=Anthonomus grandis grandis TaxID=2921223 RepID=UPI002166A2C4|nr:phytanoyl-CoA dioxygenase, peroxisomal-like [Anthonomus grandis grandis]